jgi:hypothetical protein
VVPPAAHRARYRSKRAESGDREVGAESRRITVTPASLRFDYRGAPSSPPPDGAARRRGRRRGPERPVRSDDLRLESAGLERALCCEILTLRVGASEVQTNRPEIVGGARPTHPDYPIRLLRLRRGAVLARALDVQPALHDGAGNLAELVVTGTGVGAKDRERVLD